MGAKPPVPAAVGSAETICRRGSTLEAFIATQGWREGYERIAFQNRSWYVAPSPFFCTPQVARLSIDRTTEGMEMKIVLRPDGHRAWRTATKAALGGFLALSLGGKIIGIPLVQSVVDSNVLRVMLPPEDAVFWEDAADKAQGEIAPKPSPLTDP